MGTHVVVLEDGLLVGLSLAGRDLPLAVDPPDGLGQLLNQVLPVAADGFQDLLGFVP